MKTKSLDDADQRLITVAQSDENGPKKGQMIYPNSG